MKPVVRTGLIGLAIIALLAGMLVYFLKNPRPKPAVRAPGQGERLLTFNENDCRGWWVAWGPNRCGVEREGSNAWWFRGEPREQADPVGVLANVKNFNTLDIERVVGDYPKDAARYGLDRPSNRYSWVVDVDGKSVTNTLLEGGWLENPRGVFIALEGSNKVFFAQDWVVLALQKKRGDVRPKRLIPYDPDEVSAFTVGSLSFVKEKMIWHLEGNPGAKIISARVDDLIQNLALVRAEFVFDPEEAPKTGDRPAMAVMMKGKGRGNRVLPPVIHFAFQQDHSVLYVITGGKVPKTARVRFDLTEILARDLSYYSEGPSK